MVSCFRFPPPLHLLTAGRVHEALVFFSFHSFLSLCFLFILFSSDMEETGGSPIHPVFPAFWLFRS